MGDVSETPVSPADISIEYDEEEVFWERFFERLAPVRDSVINAKQLALDSPLGDLYQIGESGINRASDLFSRSAIRTAELTYSMILRSPGLIVALLILISALTVEPAMNFQDQINGDVEIYLPDGADSTERTEGTSSISLSTGTRETGGSDISTTARKSSPSTTERADN